MLRPRSGRACLRRPRRPRPRLLARLVASQRRREAAERAARSLPGTAFRRCWRRSCAAEHAAGGQRGVPATAPGRRARAPCATYARRPNVRRWRGEERADKSCLFHHFIPNRSCRARRSTSVSTAIMGGQIQVQLASLALLSPRCRLVRVSWHYSGPFPRARGFMGSSARPGSSGP